MIRCTSQETTLYADTPSWSTIQTDRTLTLLQFPAKPEPGIDRRHLLARLLYNFLSFSNPTSFALSAQLAPQELLLQIVLQKKEFSDLNLMFRNPLSTFHLSNQDFHPAVNKS
jgi:hypothetical protein